MWPSPQEHECGEREHVGTHARQRDRSPPATDETSRYLLKI